MELERRKFGGYPPDEVNILIAVTSPSIETRKIALSTINMWDSNIQEPLSSKRTYISIPIRYENKPVRLVIIENSIKDRTGNNFIVPKYIQYAKLYLVAFLLNERKCFEGLDEYFLSIRNHSKKPILLVGIDIKLGRSIEPYEGTELAKTYNCKYIEIEYKNSKNTELFLKECIDTVVQYNN